MARFRPTQDTPFTAPVDELWRVNSGSEALHIRDLPTRRRRGFTGKKKAGQAALSQRAEVLAELQERMWAHVKAAPEDQRQALVERIAARTTEDSPAQKRRRTILMGKQTAQALNALERGPRILLVLQGMDASGKGGVVSSVVSAMDPLGLTWRRSVRRPPRNSSSITFNESSRHYRNRATWEFLTGLTTKMSSSRRSANQWTIRNWLAGWRLCRSSSSSWSAPDS